MAAEQQIHLRAQRFARVQAAEMRLYHADVGAGGTQPAQSLRRAPPAHRRCAAVLSHPVLRGLPSMVDYLHLELTRTLANDDPDLFGSTYPGPLV